MNMLICLLKGPGGKGGGGLQPETITLTSLETSSLQAIQGARTSEKTWNTFQFGISLF